MHKYPNYYIKSNLSSILNISFPIVIHLSDFLWKATGCIQTEFFLVKQYMKLILSLQIKLSPTYNKVSYLFSKLWLDFRTNTRNQGLRSIGVSTICILNLEFKKNLISYYEINLLFIIFSLNLKCNVDSLFIFNYSLSYMC